MSGTDSARVIPYSDSVKVRGGGLMASGLFPPDPVRPFDAADAFGAREPQDTSTCNLPSRVAGRDGAQRRCGDTFCDKVAEYFEARPNQWIDGREIAGFAGIYGWRTRISEVRRHYGLNIVNRQRKVGRYTVSEYMLVVPVPDADLGGGAA